MKLHKFALMAAFAASSLLLGACTSNTDTAQTKSTAFGIFTYEPGSYALNDGQDIQIRTDDISGMELPSGDRLQLFWGLVSIEDY